MEPEVLSMVRATDTIKGSKKRYPGDGEESLLLRKNTSASLPNASISNQCHSEENILTNSFIQSNNPQQVEDILSQTDPFISYTSYVSTHETSPQDLLVNIDTLKTKLKLYEEQNSQLIEEKLRLSQQLGIQSQVNNEVKKLLVASIGEDLQSKYERLIHDKAQVDLELKHLRNVMQEDREEVEQAIIQADVWRSKFFASRVMNDELARWKSALYYKYRDSHAALTSLLEEHSKIRALNNATKKGLVALTDLLDCKDPSLDVKGSLTTIDVAFMNNDLSESLVEVMKENLTRKCEGGTVVEMIEIKGTVMEKEKGRKNLTNEILVEANELTPAEQLAHEVIINTGIQTDELMRMRRDYLAHNRISHFLSTNYHVTFNCCENCKGSIKYV